MVRNKHNTPVVIKYPFWKMTRQIPHAIYVIINYGEAVCPSDIENQSICIDEDIGRVLREQRWTLARHWNLRRAEKTVPALFWGRANFVVKSFIKARVECTEVLRIERIGDKPQAFAVVFCQLCGFDSVHVHPPLILFLSWLYYIRILISTVLAHIKKDCWMKEYIFSIL